MEALSVIDDVDEGSDSETGLLKTGVGLAADLSLLRVFVKLSALALS